MIETNKALEMIWFLLTLRIPKNNGYNSSLMVPRYFQEVIPTEKLYRFLIKFIKWEIIAIYFLQK